MDAEPPLHSASSARSARSPTTSSEPSPPASAPAERPCALFRPARMGPGQIGRRLGTVPGPWPKTSTPGDSPLDMVFLDTAWGLSPGRALGRIWMTWLLGSPHAPVNVAGIPWENSQALRRKQRSGVARSSSAQPGEAAPGGGLVARAARRNRLPRKARDADSRRAGASCCRRPTSSTSTSGSHARAAVDPVPALLHAARKKCVFHYLGSDIRGKSPHELTDGKKANAEIVGSYAALRWVPEAHVVPPGLDLRQFDPAPPPDNPRPLVVHAPSNREKKGTEYVIEACAQLPVDLDIVEGGVNHEDRPAPGLREGRHRRRPAERRLARRLRGSRRWRSASRWSRTSTPRPSSRAPRATGHASRSSPRRRTRWHSRSSPWSTTHDSAAPSSAPRAAPRCVEQVHDIDKIAGPPNRNLRFPLGLTPELGDNGESVGDSRPLGSHPRELASEAS